VSSACKAPEGRDRYLGILVGGEHRVRELLIVPAPCVTNAVYSMDHVFNIAFMGSLKAGFVTERSEPGSCRALRFQYHIFSLIFMDLIRLKNLVELIGLVLNGFTRASHSTGALRHNGSVFNDMQCHKWV